MPSDTTTTPNMTLVLPVPSVRPGPTYASDIDAALTLIDGHDHSSGKGTQVPTAGIDINADLPLNSHNLTSARSLRCDNQLTTLSGTNDKCSTYFVNGNLYANNGSGAAIQITSAGSVMGAAFTSNVWAAVNTTSNLTISASDTYVSISCRHTGSPINIALPAASSVANGRYYVIIDTLGNAGTESITLVRSGGDTIQKTSANAALQSAFGTWIVRSDGVSNWDVVYHGFSGLTASSLTYSNVTLDSNGITKGPAPSTDSAALIRAANATTILSARNNGDNANVNVLGVDGANNIAIGDGTTNNDIYIDATNTIHLLAPATVTTGTFTAGGTLTLASGVTLACSNTSNITLGSSSAITYNSARTAYQMIPAWAAQSVGSGGSDAWSIDFTGTTRSGLISGASSNAFILHFAIPPQLNGATLSSIDFCYKIIGSARSPTTRLNMQVWRQTLMNTGVPSSMFTTAQQVPSYTTIGSPLTTTIAPTQNNVIDMSQYYYWIVVTDESGTGAVGGNEARGFRLSYTVSGVTL